MLISLSLPTETALFHCQLTIPKTNPEDNSPFSCRQVTTLSLGTPQACKMEIIILTLTSCPI